jgi:Coenzyme PQQ synthesis protein D (PqqD)
MGYSRHVSGRTHVLYEVSDGVRSTRNEDGGILLDVNRGKVFGLNGVGALIFQRLREHQNETQIVEELSRQFDIPVQSIRADLVEFLRSLEQQGLVTTTQDHFHDTQTR